MAKGVALKLGAKVLVGRGVTDDEAKMKGDQAAERQGKGTADEDDDDRCRYLVQRIVAPLWREAGMRPGR